MKRTTGITIVVAIGIACLIGGSLTKDVNAYETDDDVKTPETTPLTISTEKEGLEKQENFVLYVGTSKIWTRPFIAKEAPLIESKITDSSDLTSIFTDREYDLDLTSDCSNKRIYVLKSTTPPYDYPEGDRVLDVIEYDNNNNFQRIKRVFNMFKRAKSIASDWTTGKLYWIEYVEEKKYAIKVTNKLFDEPEYVVQPTVVQSQKFRPDEIGKMQVYPKKNEIFFLIGDNTWYTSNALNSTPHILFPSMKTKHRFRIAIDYALDKLYWNTDDSLKCVNISHSTRPLNPKSIDSQYYDISNNAFSVFNNIYYWVIHLSNKIAVLMENGNRREVVESLLNNNADTLLMVFFPNCSCQSKESKNFVLLYDSFTIWTRPYFAEYGPFMKYEITDSPNFTSNEYEVGLTSDCSNKRIYILKTLTPHEDYPNADRVLDVYKYDDNNKFQRIQRNSHMFNGAVSIASDWTTGNLYWIETIERYKHAIKVTNKFFNESNYVIQPTKGYLMDDITVYPKKNELFFLFNQDIWYTSNLPNSTAHSLFLSSTGVEPSFNIFNDFSYPLDKSSWKGFEAINDIPYFFREQNLVIDYALDKLCWLSWIHILNCVKISDSNRPFDQTLADSQKTSRGCNRFTVFNSISYCITDERRSANRENVNKSGLVKSNVGAKFRRLIFFSPNCSYKVGNVDNAITSSAISTTTDESKKPKNFVLSVDSFKIWTRPYTAENAPSIETKITDSLDFASKFTKMVDVDLTSDCSNKRIYVLKSTTPPYDYPNGDRVLDVIEYDNSNKFQRIKRVSNMFKRAKSIASDWTTGKLYWIEYVEEKKYAIKVTNKLFDKPEYVIQPTIVQSASSSAFVVGNIQVYPKKNEIFFLIGDDIWCTPNALNSTPHLLFPSMETSYTFKIAIDYALDKLCWNTDDSLKCVNISDSTRPLNPQSIDSQDIDYSHSIFSVLNNIYYWVVDINKKKSLYMENGNKSEVVASRLNENYKSLFRVFSPNCSCQSKRSENFVLIYDTFTIRTRPYFVENTPFTEYEVTDSPNFSSNEDEVGLTSDCSNKRIYILKTLTPHEDYLNADQVLDVIQYDDNNKFQRIQRVSNMFNGTVSIASDWTTGNIYWTEYLGENKYAVKVTNKFFNESNYVIQPTIGYLMDSIRVYPKKNELFYLFNEDIWYTSNSPNSTAHLLFSSSMRENGPLNIVIDYALDKLCWKNLASLQCADISVSTRPLNVKSIDRQPLRDDHLGFTVFNNIYYWLIIENQGRVVYRKNGNKNELVKSNVGANSMKSFFFSPNCPYETDDYVTTPETTLLSESTGEDQPEIPAYFFVFKFPNEILTRPYFTKNIRSTKVEISNSPNFSLSLSQKMYTNISLISGCFNDKVYILKKITDGLERKNVLDVFKYDENKEFQRIEQLYDEFNLAESIASDWTTGNIYWIEYINDNKFSIKVTNKFFNESNYVIPPFTGFLVSNIQVYPKQNITFFLNDYQIWYTSTLPNSTPELLFNSTLNGSLSNLVIDYALDKLCWYSPTHLNCVYIGGSTRPLNEQDIDRQPKLRDSPQFAVFNNIYYWSKDVNERKVLYMKNGNDISQIESYVTG